MFIQNANQRLNVRNVVIEIMMLSGSLFRSGVDTVTADLFSKAYVPSKTFDERNTPITTCNLKAIRPSDLIHNWINHKIHLGFKLLLNLGSGRLNLAYFLHF